MTWAAGGAGGGAGAAGGAGRQHLRLRRPQHTHCCRRLPAGLICPTSFRPLDDSVLGAACVRGEWSMKAVQGGAPWLLTTAPFLGAPLLCRDQACEPCTLCAQGVRDALKEALRIKGLLEMMHEVLSGEASGNWIRTELQCHMHHSIKRSCCLRTLNPSQRPTRFQVKVAEAYCRHLNNSCACRLGGRLHS